MAAKVFGGILWGMIADRWRCHRMICILTSFLSILCLVGQLGAGLALANERTSSCKFDITSSIYSFKNTTTTTTTTTTPSSLMNLTNTNKSDSPIQRRSVNHTFKIEESQLLVSVSEGKEKEKFGTLFFVILFLSVLNLLCDCHLAFLDTGTIRKIQIINSTKTANTRKVNYGTQRSFAPLGAAFGNFVANLSIQYFPQSRVSCFTGMFICYTIFLLLICASVLFIYHGLSFKEKSNDDVSEVEDDKDLIRGGKSGMDKSFIPDKDVSTPDNGNENPGFIEFNKAVDGKVNYRKLLFRTMFRGDILFLLISTAISGMFFSPMISFHYLLLKDLNAPAITFSLITAVGGIGATIAFKFSNKILKMLAPFRTLGLCYLTTAFIQLGYGLADTAWVPVSLRAPFGLTHCLSLAAGLHYLKDTCPVDVLTSLISVYVSMFYGIGPGIGLAISGEVYGAYGGKTLFCSVAILSFSWSLVVGLYCIYCFRNKSLSKK